MYTHSREFPCMYLGIHRSHIKLHNRINVKITKQNAAIKYMQKVTVAELKAIPVVCMDFHSTKGLFCVPYSGDKL